MRENIRIDRACPGSVDRPLRQGIASEDASTTGLAIPVAGGRSIR
jgi:hypothetical protein